MSKPKSYRVIRSCGKFIRNNFALDPTKALHVFGMIGKIIGLIINYVIAKPIHWIVFGLVGLVYQKDKHPRWVGALLYTAYFIFVMGLLSMSVSLLVRK